MTIKGINRYGCVTIKNDPGIGQPMLINSLMSGFNLSSEEQNEDIMAFLIGGQGSLDVAYNVLKSRTWTLETNSLFEWGSLQMNMKMFAANSTTVGQRVSTVGRVPDATPYEIVDANLSGLAVSDVLVSILTTETNIYTPLQVVEAAPTAAGEVQLDATNNKLIFHSSQAGKPFSYQVKQTWSNVTTIGKEQTTETLDYVSFAGDINAASAPNIVTVDIPKMGRIGGFGLNVSEATSTMQFRPFANDDSYSPITFLITPV